MSVRRAVLVVALAMVTTGCVMTGGYRRSVLPRPAYYPPPAPPSSASIDVGFFYDSLAPYGDWYLDVDLGWVWAPRGVAYGWRPYTEGYWLYTDYGWTWASSWNWGWAPFHYGRWSFHPRRGWFWVPGRDWAPAWVAWRSGSGMVGWAPLPPGVHFRVGVGLDFGNVALDTMLDVHWWSFVDERRLTDRRLRAHVVPEPRNVTLVRTTRDVTRYEVTRDRVIVRGVDVDEVSRARGRAVPRYVLREDTSREETGPARIRSGEVYMYRPAVREVGPERTPPGHARRVQPPPSPRPPTARPAPERPSTPRRTAPATRPPAPQAPERPVTAVEDRERTKLEEQLRRERAVLERQHRKEAARPPERISREELRRRQQQELKAFREKAARERALRAARAREEQQRAKSAKPLERKSRGAARTRRDKKPDPR